MCVHIERGKKPNKRKGKGKEREKVEIKGMCTITYQFCMAEEIRGPVISFPDSTLKEGKRSCIHSSFAGKRGGGEKN